MGCGNKYSWFSVVLVLFLCDVACSYGTEKPCVARLNSDSVECVCNATYCDEITRDTPARNTFYVYTTSKSGLRFEKKSGWVRYYSIQDNCLSSLHLNPNILYQSVEGFGGAVSDSSAALWTNLTDPRTRQYLIDSYFGKSGIEYNMLRVPIGATDFSPKVYTYQDAPEGDLTLSNFKLTDQDYLYKIPMIKAAEKAATETIHTMATLWGPPLWMKTEREVGGVGRVKDECYQALAEYHYKFLEEYAAEGVHMWGLSTPNEPLSGVMSLGTNFRVTWTVDGLSKWVAEHIGPMLREGNSTFRDVKLIVGEDMRMTIPMWFDLIVMKNPEVLKYIDGVGVHFYFDPFTPPEMLTVPMRGHEDKFVIYTESSLDMHGSSSWDKAKRYAVNILEDLNFNVTGFIDWNLCLNPKGGPSWTGMALDAPVIVDLDKAEFRKQPMFYALGHFSKFIPRGSRRIATVEKFPCGPRVENVSFLTPRNTIVTVLHNGNKENYPIQINVGQDNAMLTLAPESITTVEFGF